ncbi:glycine-rich protein 1 [Halyomorpha halys]|uniref:glycine-rich protein 1 n=1 Tax=Halyomorpha halys TaxID=286706 RepID=UPI0006D50A24|nr:merozoite surface antigen 2, allelic form 2-like [Halyomorpha halys]
MKCSLIFLVVALLQLSFAQPLEGSVKAETGAKAGAGGAGGAQAEGKAQATAGGAQGGAGEASSQASAGAAPGLSVSLSPSYVSQGMKVSQSESSSTQTKTSKQSESQMFGSALSSGLPGVGLNLGSGLLGR